MKKIIALFGSLLLFAGTKLKAQNPAPVPVKKETAKPSSGSAPKTEAVDEFLKLGTTKGEQSKSGAKGVNPNFTKGSNPKPSDGSGSGSGSGSSGQSVAPHPTPPPVQSVAPRHKG